MAGVPQLNSLVQGPWLGRGTAESLGGSYGSPPPADLASLKFAAIANASDVCTLPQVGASRNGRGLDHACMRFHPPLSLSTPPSPPVPPPH